MPAPEKDAEAHVAVEEEPRRGVRWSAAMGAFSAARTVLLFSSRRPALMVL